MKRKIIDVFPAPRGLVCRFEEIVSQDISIGTFDENGFPRETELRDYKVIGFAAFDDSNVQEPLYLDPGGWINWPGGLTHYRGMFFV